MLKTWTFRYAVFGILIGLIFPIVDTLSTLAEQNLPLTLDSILYVQFGAGHEIDRWIKIGRASCRERVFGLV